MSDEFEAVLAAMAETHRVKSATYGSDEDPYQNFEDGAWLTNTTPYRAGEQLMAKHVVAIKNWLGREPNADRDPEGNDAMDDAHLDRAVYAVIQLIRYRRNRAASQSASDPTAGSPPVEAPGKVPESPRPHVASDPGAGASVRRQQGAAS